MALSITSGAIINELVGRLARHTKPRGVCRLLLSFACLVASPLQAQDGMTGFAPWSSFGAPMRQSTTPSMPFSHGMGLPTQPDLAGPYRKHLRDAWQMPYGGSSTTGPENRSTEGEQPDLTGVWRGNGGETVEIQHNHARIWSGNKRPCSCVFFLVGQRLIAYSPDTDMVRKYWFLNGSHQFSLIDEAGNLMSFQQTR